MTNMIKIPVTSFDMACFSTTSTTIEPQEVALSIACLKGLDPTQPFSIEVVHDAYVIYFIQKR